MSVTAFELQAGETTAWGARLRNRALQALDAQRGRTFLWSAPALAAGVGFYFSLPVEPGFGLSLALALLGGMLMWLGRGRPLLLLVGVAALGFAAAKLQAISVSSPLLAASTGEVEVTGRVVSIGRSSPSRLVMVIAPDALEGFEVKRLPGALRLSLLAKSGHPPAGSRVRFKARLLPLPSPVEPGGFDYGRSLWLQGIGGTGRVTSAVLTLAEDVPLMARAGAWLSDLRGAMGARVHAALAEPYASFAEALITGERSTIPPEINRSLLISGLYHILSISGLHMWLVAGGVFWGVRATLALVPGLALSCPIRKWAAAAALLMGLFYMLLADSGVATARSFLMIAIVFFAILVDRPALSLRNLALAALVLLVIDPAAAIEAGFQMSFLAVLGLIAFHEAWSRYRTEQEESDNKAARHWSVRIGVWALAAVAASLVTSLVAGFSSSLPAAYHFGRISPYGVLANGLAIPVVGIVVMPAALVAVLLMPFGLEQLPLTVMGKGLELVVMISDRVAALPGANEVIARPPTLAMVVIAGGMVLLCLLVGPLRLVGLAVMGIGAGLALGSPPPPDLLIDATGQNMALRDAEGHLVPALGRRGRFAVEKWLLANGEETSLAEAASRPGWSCTGNRCSAEVRGRRIVFVSRGEGQPLDCANVDVLVTDFPLRHLCRSVPLRIDRFDLWRSGAHAVRFAGPDTIVTTARGEQGQRPWTIKPEARRTVFVPASPQEDTPRN